MSRKTSLITAASALAMTAAFAVPASAQNLNTAIGGSSAEATVELVANNPIKCQIGASTNENENGNEFRLNNDGTNQTDDDTFSSVVNLTHGCNTAYEVTATSTQFTQDNGDGAFKWNFTNVPASRSNVEEYGESSSINTIIDKSEDAAVADNNLTTTVSLDLLSRGQAPERLVAAGKYRTTVIFTITPEGNSGDSTS